MSASAADRRHAELVGLAMDLQASLADEAALDARRDARIRAALTFIRALRDWILEHVPGARRAFLLLAGIADALRGERALDLLVDAENAKQLELAREIAGLLDHVDEDVAAAVTA